MSIASVAIHPAIGVARVGNSPSGFFVGPELPGMPAHADGGFKDADGSGSFVKRQAARFRLFAFDEAGVLVGELTAADAVIEWTVELANAKAEWDKFDGRKGEVLGLQGRRDRSEWRNRDVRDEARSELVIRAAPAMLSGAHKRATFAGTFLGEPVELGEARTDTAGRLLVLGGSGRAGTTEPGRQISHYANNDRWFDDIADGPVRARVRLPDGRVLDAKPAWVVSAPPDFSPETMNPVTLYDVAYDTLVQSGRLAPPARPSFTRHIQPILERGLGIAWTNRSALDGHRASAAWFDWPALADPAPAAEAGRRRLLAVFRNPFLTGADAVAQANKRFMPALAGDEGDCEEDKPDTWLSLTRTQYRMLEQWAAGDFEGDWTGVPVPSFDITPDGLDRAALEACSGGAFYPGIEASWLLRNPDVYSEPYRLDASRLAPGDVTKRMAVPWQADFFECNTWWWPAQRPDDVLPAAAFERLQQIEAELANPRLGTTGSDGVVREELQREQAELLASRVVWARELPERSYAGDNAMVEQWPTLGFVTSRSANGEALSVNGQPVLVEQEKAPAVDHRDLREAFYKLVNIDRFPEFRPVALRLAQSFFKGADYAADPHYAPFPYTVAGFRRRLDDIYGAYVADIDEAHWLEDFSREAVIENLRQKAPMNLVDGAWLHHILAAGPTDDVKAKLFAIWADEAGNGFTELNHSNVYDALLRSVDVYLPPISSIAFRELDLLPSAWENPVFQMAVGLFPDRFLPELLGMTLYLEWEATPTMMPVVRMLERHQIDPQFYRMHMAIDNVTAGHGGLAREAVELYLDNVRGVGGTAAVDTAWQRVWNGYVTWATLGHFGSDLAALLEKFDRRGDDAADQAYARERMIALVRAKAPYARTAHGVARLGGTTLAALFADPDRLLDAMVAEGWVNPAEPRQSRLITELTGFHGPMYKVFSAEEFDILLDWIDSLAARPAPPVGAAERVRRAIDRLMARGAAESQHAGPTLPDSGGQPRSLADWFAAGDPVAIMGALARSHYVATGNPGASALLNDVFRMQMPDVLSRDETEAFAEWISLGCPLPARRAELAGARRAVARREATPPDGFAKRRLFIGAGAVH